MAESRCWFRLPRGCGRWPWNGATGGPPGGSTGNPTRLRNRGRGRFCAGPLKRPKACGGCRTPTGWRAASFVVSGGSLGKARSPSSSVRCRCVSERLGTGNGVVMPGHHLPREPVGRAEQPCPGVHRGFGRRGAVRGASLRHALCELRMACRQGNVRRSNPFLTVACARTETSGTSGGPWGPWSFSQGPR